MDVDPERKALIIAEDVLQQTYYLGKVDYWLREIGDAKLFAVIRNGYLVDQYTATTVIGTGEDLLSVVEENADRDIFVIGSGEDFIDGKRIFRGNGIGDVLESDRFEVVYEGRDEKTKVWIRSADR
jgi:hypothetical protein